MVAGPQRVGRTLTRAFVQTASSGSPHHCKISTGPDERSSDVADALGDSDFIRVFGAFRRSRACGIALVLSRRERGRTNACSEPYRLHRCSYNIKILKIRDRAAKGRGKPPLVSRRALSASAVRAILVDM